MKKFLNDPQDCVPQSVAGMVAAHDRLLALNKSPFFVYRREPKERGVVVVSGGGSGHEPLDTGYVGLGMLDAACPGRVFTAPTPEQIAAAVRCVAHADGALLIVKNYPADVNSFELARDMLDMPLEWVLVNDEVAGTYGNPNPNLGAGRRGLAGTVIVEKITGAAAQSGCDLLECKRLGDKTNQLTATLGVALTSCTVPGAAATFDIGPAEIEIGVGLHGEPGSLRTLIATADQIAATMVEAVTQDLQLQAGSSVLLLVNGLGGTPLSELYVLHHAAFHLLAEMGIRVERSLVGNYATALETAGASISLTVLDEELMALWDAPVQTASLRW